MSKEDKIFEIDLYELLGITTDCSSEKVKKAYRKKALTCHPDKNPDNPKAAELFHQLSKALEILLDDSARAAYNKVLGGRRAAKIRHRELDSRRKKFKEELEAREKVAERSPASSRQVDSRTDEQKLRAEIERLRKEGSKQLAEEIALIQRQVEEEQSSAMRLLPESENDANSTRLKLRWHASKDDEENGGYNQDSLQNILRKYGDIVAVIMSKKKGSAMVEFETKDAATMALQFEKGFVKNPITVECIGHTARTKHSLAAHSLPTTLAQDSDFESLVFRRMRQAEERKRLIDEMKAEDD